AGDRRAGVTPKHWHGRVPLPGVFGDGGNRVGRVSYSGHSALVGHSEPRAGTRGRVADRGHGHRHHQGIDSARPGFPGAGTERGAAPSGYGGSGDGYIRRELADWQGNLVGYPSPPAWLRGAVGPRNHHRPLAILRPPRRPGSRPGGEGTVPSTPLALL